MSGRAGLGLREVAADEALGVDLSLQNVEDTAAPRRPCVLPATVRTSATDLVARRV
jgi:hypothetical protein